MKLLCLLFSNIQICYIDPQHCMRAENFVPYTFFTVKVRFLEKTIYHLSMDWVNQLTADQLINKLYPSVLKAKSCLWKCLQSQRFWLKQMVGHFWQQPLSLLRVCVCLCVQFANIA